MIENRVKMYDRESFICLARKRHGDKFDYSNSNYLLSNKKVEIKCPKHGVFFQTPSVHIKSNYGCLKCSCEAVHEKQKLTTDIFIKKAKEIHGDKYDYSKSVYHNIHIKIEIICPKHGSFWQKSGNHISCKKGCLKCRNEGNRKRFQMGREKFIELASKYHSNSYDYSLVEYINCDTKVKIICRIHNEIFEQTPFNHFKCNKNRACPSCGYKKSSQEDFIKNELEKLKISFHERKRTIVPPNELDFYIPKYNLAIECNGLFWHSEFQGNFRGKDCFYHLNKSNKCASKNIKLFHFLETDVQNKKRLVLSVIKRYLKCGKYQIPSEKCQIKEILQNVKSKFLNKYELNGDIKSNLNLGLFYKGRLISVAALLRYKSGQIRVLRLSEIFSFSVIDGWQKLEEYVCQTYNPNGIQIKLNNNWPRNDISLSDFTVKRKTEPKPWYYSDSQIKTTKLYTERQFINKLKKQGKYNDNISVAENCVNNKWNRIWDTGSTIYEKQL